MNDLNIVISNEKVPFPIDWKIFPERTPNGMKSRKKHKILNASTTLGAKTELSDEYENMNDSGSANIKRNEQTIIDEIIPNFKP